MEINSKDALDDSARKHKSGKFLNTVACVVGANASGKTSLIKAFSFLSWFVDTSYSSMKADRAIPMDLHKLHKKEAAKIAIEFYQEGVLYTYSLELDEKRVIKESLHKRKNEKYAKAGLVFDLSRQKDRVIIKSGNDLKISEHDEDRIKRRPNISLLSALIDLEYLPEITFFKKTVTNVSQVGHSRPHSFEDSFHFSEALSGNKFLSTEILSFSDVIDLGISDFRFHKISYPNKNNPEEEMEAQILLCLHKSPKFSFELPIFEESNGTQRSYFILSKILPILKSGGLIILDEIEDGLHPNVVRKIITLFERKDSNPHNAQLIFSTHQHLLLNDRTKTQIFITEKNPQTFETEIYRLDDVEDVRNDENYFHKYMAGAFGGTPNVKWL